MVFVAVFVVVAIAVLIVIAPLRRGRAERAELLESTEVAELEAQRDARYREIRDAEMDFRTGKLSERDYRQLDRGLRAEAIDILRRLDRAGGGLPSWSATEALQPGAEEPGLVEDDVDQVLTEHRDRERVAEPAEARSENRAS